MGLIYKMIICVYQMVLGKDWLLLDSWAVQNARQATEPQKQ